jgi:tRNA (guanine37-N1)-methyltransferase
MAKDLAKEEDLIIICGHYEGVDERVLEIMEAEPVSIGDYVLTGGELPAMVMVDAISRMIPDVLTNADSKEEESFSSVRPKEEFTRKARKEVYGDLINPDAKEEITLLEYPQYTRPEVFMGRKVPEVLLSGDHAKIEQWRRKQSLERTKKIRPDLLD